MRVMLDTNIIISGDKDFEELEIEKTEILKPSEFLQRY